MVNKAQVVILIITHKPVLTAFEQISIQQCVRILGDYQKVFICPKVMNTHFYTTHFPEIAIHQISSYWQSNYKRFNRLKVLPLLYKTFQQYEYILFYEPDVFVFRDELLDWCNKGYSYIGAPWLEGLDSAKQDAAYQGVGNGGFSLRKVEDHLKALHRFSVIYRLSDITWYLKGGKYWGFQLIKFIYRLLVGNTTYYRLNNFWWNEDQFWGRFVNRNFEWFRVAPVEEALKFSFEVQPQKMFSDNQQQLPFGCHAWWRYDLEFWKPFIEEYGYKLDE